MSKASEPRTFVFLSDRFDKAADEAVLSNFQGLDVVSAAHPVFRVNATKELVTKFKKAHKGWTIAPETTLPAPGPAPVVPGMGPV